MTTGGGAETKQQCPVSRGREPVPSMSQKWCMSSILTAQTMTTGGGAETNQQCPGSRGKELVPSMSQRYQVMHEQHIDCADKPGHEGVKQPRRHNPNQRIQDGHIPKQDEKRNQEVASSAGKVVQRVIAYTNVQINNTVVVARFNSLQRHACYCPKNVQSSALNFQ